MFITWVSFCPPIIRWVGQKPFKKGTLLLGSGNFHSVRIQNVIEHINYISLVELQTELGTDCFNNL